MANGYCECGCGGLTSIVQRTDNARGQIAGQPMRFLLGHQRRGRLQRPEKRYPVGLCECGCGQRTAIATQTRTATGEIQGQPKRFLPHHSKMGRLPPQFANRWADRPAVVAAPADPSMDRCLRCGYTWPKRTPRCCPKCKSPYWNRERGSVRRGRPSSRLSASQ
jgi:hypothetical protein